MNHKKQFFPACCSSMTLTSDTGQHYWFRTCDVEDDLWNGGAHVVQKRAGAILTYYNGRKEICKYGFLGMTYNEWDSWMLDGVNEAGLCGGLLMLSEGTSVDKADKNRTGYMGMELVTKILSFCKNVEEVISLTEKIQILSIPQKETFVAASMHYFFTDSQGNEVVLEAVREEQPGILQIHKKEEILGVMTNSPPYPLQKENLAWFLSQSPEMRNGILGKPVKELYWDGRVIRADENAKHLSVNGTFPASYSSYDRFIRLAVLKALNNSGNNFSKEEMLAQGSNIMWAVHEPCHQGIFHYSKVEKNGTVTGQKSSKTQYLIMYDLEEKSFFIKIFDMVSWIEFRMENNSKELSQRYDIIRNSKEGILKGNF